MREWFEKFFANESAANSDQQGRPTIKELQVGAVFLLVEVAAADGDFHPNEANSIGSLIEAQFGWTESEAVKLLMEGYQRYESKTFVEQYLQLLDSRFSAEQKELLLSLLLYVANVDGTIKSAEEKMIQRFQKAFQLSESSLNRARVRAQSIQFIAEMKS